MGQKARQGPPVPDESAYDGGQFLAVWMVRKNPVEMKLACFAGKLVFLSATSKIGGADAAGRPALLVEIGHKKLVNGPVNDVATTGGFLPLTQGIAANHQANASWSIR